MPRPSHGIPRYLRHRPSNRAFVILPGPNGKKKYVYLGLYGSEESRREYARIVAEVGASAAKQPAGMPVSLSMNELIARFKEFAQVHYRRPDGTHSYEVRNFGTALRPVRELYGHTPAAEFGPLALKAVRQAMIGKGWCRKQINGHVGRVKRLFKWAASEELVPATVFHALQTVTGLRRGRSAAPDRPKVQPVPQAAVEKTLPFLNRHVAGLVRFQLLTGCRPGEACALRRCDLDATGDVWTYRPGQHKGEWRDHDRTIAVGPRAQALLKEFFTDDPAAFLFSPRLATAEFHADRSARRRTPRYASHMRRNEAKRTASPKRQPAEKYDTLAYGTAVARAAEKAGVPHWHPNQLRHTHGTLVRKQFGLEAAQVALGHQHAAVTQIYAERNAELAARVAREVG